MTIVHSQKIKSNTVKNNYKNKFYISQLCKRINKFNIILKILLLIQQVKDSIDVNNFNQ